VIKAEPDCTKMPRPGTVIAARQDGVQLRFGEFLRPRGEAAAAFRGWHLSGVIIGQQPAGGVAEQCDGISTRQRFLSRAIIAVQAEAGANQAQDSGTAGSIPTRTAFAHRDSSE
jgi:hypothetical protein